MLVLLVLSQVTRVNFQHLAGQSSGYLSGICEGKPCQRDNTKPCQRDNTQQTKALDCMQVGAGCLAARVLSDCRQPAKASTTLK